MKFSAKPLPTGKNSFYLTRSLLLCSPSRPTISCSSFSVPKLSVLLPAPALDCGSFYCVLVKMGCARRFFLSVKKRTAACCKHATVLWVSRMVRHHDHLGGLCPHRSVPMPILRRPTWQRQVRTGLFSSGLVRTVLLSGSCSRSNRREGSPLHARPIP